MRKLLFAAVGLATVFTALPLYAAEVNFSGEFRVRGFWTNNLTDGDSGGLAAGNEDMARFNDQRFRLKTAIKAGVTTGVVVLDFGNCFVGADVATFNGGVAPTAPFTGDCRFGTGGLGSSFNVVGVREAHLDIDLTNVRAILGRQTIKLGHGIVFDDTVDAVTLMFPMGAATLTASMLQIADASDALGVAAADINNDTTVWVLNVGMDHGNHVINIYDALVYDGAPAFSTANTIYPTGVAAAGPIGVAPTKMWVNFIGVSADVGSGPTKLAFEGSYSIGEVNETALTRIRVHGWNVMGDVTTEAGGAKVGATVVVADGHDPSAVNDVSVSDISGNFQLGNILLNNEQLSDRDGGSLGGGAGGVGITAAKLHASMMPSDKVTVGGALIYALGERPCSRCGRGIGLEVDANAAYAVDENLALSASAGYLFTGDGAEDFYRGAASGIGGDNDLWKLVGRAVFTF
jgi:hypothetical protein